MLAVSGQLDLTPGALEKTNDPVRLYLREMGVVPLLTREGEVAIAKRIERGQIKTQKAIARSPIAIPSIAAKLSAMLCTSFTWGALMLRW